MLERAIDQGFLACFFWSEMKVFREPTPQRLAALRRTARHFREQLAPKLNTLLGCSACMSQSKATGNSLRVSYGRQHPAPRIDAVSMKHAMRFQTNVSF